MSDFQLDTPNVMARDCHITAANHGFWDYPPEVSKVMQYMSKIALIHSEASEALEELRKTTSPEPSHLDQHWGNFGSELADIIIRVFDLAHDAGVDLDYRIRSKMKQNENRPHMHGKRA